MCLFQGWQVSPLHGKTMVITQLLLIWQKYFLSRGEMAERGETKFGEMP